MTFLYAALLATLAICVNYAVVSSGKVGGNKRLHRRKRSLDPAVRYGAFRAGRSHSGTKCMGSECEKCPTCQGSELVSFQGLCVRNGSSKEQNSQFERCLETNVRKEELRQLRGSGRIEEEDLREELQAMRLKRKAELEKQKEKEEKEEAKRLKKEEKRLEKEEKEGAKRLKKKKDSPDKEDKEEAKRLKKEKERLEKEGKKEAKRLKKEEERLEKEEKEEAKRRGKEPKRASATTTVSEGKAVPDTRNTAAPITSRKESTTISTPSSDELLQSSTKSLMTADHDNFESLDDCVSVCDACHTCGNGLQPYQGLCIPHPTEKNAGLKKKEMRREYMECKFKEFRDYTQFRISFGKSDGSSDSTLSYLPSSLPDDGTPAMEEKDKHGNPIDDEITSSYGKCRSSIEGKLVRLINEYRAQKEQYLIPASKTMTKVAQWHSWDLAKNKPNAQPNCNMHSWSSAKPDRWSAGCYTSVHNNPELMWKKAREFGGKKCTANGFEISAWTSGKMTAEEALKQWQNSPGHDAIATNSGMWASVKFMEMGCGIFQGGHGVGGFANCWFMGQGRSDKSGAPMTTEDGKC